MLTEPDVDASSGPAQVNVSTRERYLTHNSTVIVYLLVGMSNAAFVRLVALRVYCGAESS